MSLPPSVRHRVEQFVRPLYVGLDGIQSFDRIPRLERRIAELRSSEDLDEELLELLLLFHGAVERLGSLSRGGRLHLFLQDLGLGEDLIQQLCRALGRFRSDPRLPEEAILHDALLLEEAGITACLQRLMTAGRRRVAAARALTHLGPGPPAESYRTAAGARLGAVRRQEAQVWLEELRQKVDSELS